MWWKAAALLCLALAITACGQTSPTAPTSGGDKSSGLSNVPEVKTPDGKSPSRRTADDDHVEPPGVLPPG